jgi:endoglucanase
MDEIGFVVRHITEDGFLFLDTAQGNRREGPAQVHQHMIGSFAQVLGRDGVVAQGVFASSSGHVSASHPGRDSSPGWSDFFVDLGLTSRAEVLALGVHIGSSVVFATDPRVLGHRLVGKAMDDRVALAVMDLWLTAIQPAELSYELWFAATVQEEPGPGRHGATALASRLGFDYVVSLDVGLVGDIPTIGQAEYETSLGGGPTLVHKDNSHFYDATLLWHFADVAAKEGISYQHGVFASYGSDGMAFLRRAIPTILVAIPARYTHTSFEMVDPGDVLATVSLLSAFTRHSSLTLHERKPR